MALAASGRPSTFLTLTVNPDTPGDPAEHLTHLMRAAKLLKKRLRRAYPDDEIEWLGVVETTKRGEPHLHILARMPYVPQALISAIMDELINAPVVDIRRVRSQTEVVRYVAKYIAKSPAHFENRKRYFRTAGYELKDEAVEQARDPDDEPWKVQRDPMGIVIVQMHGRGYMGHRDPDDADLMWFWPMPDYHPT